MTSPRLYSGPLSMFGAKAEIAVREKGLDFELVMVPFDREDRYEPRHPDVLRVNPKRQVPVLIHGESRSSIPPSSSNIWKMHFPSRLCGPRMRRRGRRPGCWG